MNWVDGVILIVLIYSTCRGLLSGLILSLTGLLSILLGLLVAVKNYQALADWLIVGWQFDEKLMQLFKPLLNLYVPAYHPDPASTALLNNGLGDTLLLTLSRGLLSIICFIILLIMTDLAVKLMGRLINKLLGWGLLSPINRLGGALFGVARGILVVLIIILILQPFQADILKESHVANIFLDLLSRCQGSDFIHFFYNYRG
ncbi:CvpA family protein [Desulfofalx alkaliphila]|uniref:CvpA family protein n=1 Tax=Desulfofalx alkaliphila TaxID=105483 RepID=UPI0004E241E9|nr:CvpA family protein [Desulfofalx alkaliphila]